MLKADQERINVGLTNARERLAAVDLHLDTIEKNLDKSYNEPGIPTRLRRGWQRRNRAAPQP